MDDLLRGLNLNDTDRLQILSVVVLALETMLSIIKKANGA